MNLQTALTPEPRRAEMRRRRVTLASVLALLALGLFGFYSVQSLAIRFRPYEITRVWLPAATARVTPVPDFGTGSAQGIPVLVYHGIQPKGETVNVTPETFLSHMRALHDAGYTTLSMREFADFMASGRRLPAKSVLITFDDGRTDSFSGADPILWRYGYRATMFTILGDARSGKAFYLTEAETKLMARTGRWDVESHTAYSHEYKRTSEMGASGHPLANRLWLTPLGRLESDDEYAGRVQDDLTVARDGIRRLTGKPVIAFAYPWGDYGQQSGDPVVREKLPSIAQSLYPVTFSQARFTLDETYNYPSDNGTTLRRISVSYDMSAGDLMRRLERGEPKSLPFADTGSLRSTGWALTDGRFETTSAGRSVVSDPRVFGGRAEAFLDGSRAWRDYDVATRLSLNDADTRSIIVRRASPNDYVAATFTAHYVSIEEVIGGQQRTLAEADVNLVKGEHAVDVAASGPSVALRVDGVTLARTANVAGSLSRGGIALRIDPARPDSVRLALPGLTVTPLSGAFQANSMGVAKVVAR